jgi:propionyl-CoA carboxylase beta chain
MNLLDGGRYLEIQELFGAELMTGFGRIEGQSVGFVACRRSVSDGWLSSTAATKAARFIRTCDAFNISLITVVDSFGFRLRPGEDVEEVARDGAKLVHAYAEADVPMVTLIIGNAFGEAYAMLGSKHLGADFNFAWPSARIGIAYRAPHTARDCDQDAAETRSDFEAAYAKSIKDPYLAAERGYLDAVIHPDGTRETVARSLRLLTEKTRVAPIRKHENLPL